MKSTIWTWKYQNIQNAWISQSQAVILMTKTIYIVLTGLDCIAQFERELHTHFQNSEIFNFPEMNSDEISWNLLQFPEIKDWPVDIPTSPQNFSFCSFSTITNIQN